jgi:hypothetical protein
VKGGLEGRETIILEHMEKSRFASVIESEKEDFTALVDEA